MADFDKAFKLLMDLEGGWSNDLHDMGGLTRFGISSAAHPEIDLTTLTVDSVKPVYKNSYWTPSGCLGIKDQDLAEEVFLAAVNAGVFQGVKVLQSSINNIAGFPFVAIDGKAGPMVAGALSLLENVGQAMLLRRTFELEMIKYYTGLKNFVNFGRGWCNRVLAADEI